MLSSIPNFIFLLFGFLYAVLWIWALIDLLKSDFKNPNMKLIWAVVVVFANPIGPFIYFIISKGQKINQRKYFNLRR
ncbi:PLD nuclease N-terminal domain-containing protein [Aquiflexum lacus]|uniref:PLD nuclease N-terminal domain-containing protein n=1 Tax=Aquiflexum lacus TaxID=2483805 RepID=UPI0018950D7A|nr:PLD nuclease N-terminal domain-containing protein [Aquiflexum lacus]